MNILITAGGTSEAIDKVRSITNHSTGRLGSIIADFFANRSAAITYVCGHHAALPQSGNIEIIRISNVQELSQTISMLLKKNKYDCVIHSMAVSDFTPQAVLTLSDIIESVASTLASSLQKHPTNDELRAAIKSATATLPGTKLSSKTQEPLILLTQTPKIINQIKTLQPNTTLVGFKLLSGATEADLLQAATNLMTQANCDFVLANDLQNIQGDTHKAILLDKAGNTTRAATKQEIAKTIYKAITHHHQNNTRAKRSHNSPSSKQPASEAKQ